MATTLRLPPELAADATAYAAKLGISVNALVAVALREYIDGRVIRPSGAPSPNSPGEAIHTNSNAAVKPPAPAASKPAQQYRAPRSRSDPCPCGARNSDGHPLRWKQCHGKAN